MTKWIRTIPSWHHDLQGKRWSARSSAMVNLQFDDLQRCLSRPQFIGRRKGADVTSSSSPTAHCTIAKSLQIEFDQQLTKQSFKRFLLSMVAHWVHIWKWCAARSIRGSGHSRCIQAPLACYGLPRTEKLEYVMILCAI